QTYSPIECIVVDDGSTDETMAVLKRFDGKVNAVVQSNCGPSAARNTGIRLAKGNYIAFLDADDWWEPTKIEKQMDLLLSDPSVGAVGCGTRLIQSSGDASIRHVAALTEEKEQNIRLI